MVEPVSINITSAAARIAQAPAPVSAVTQSRALSGADEAKVTLPGVAKSLAASPPVDLERVARIKKAIADGTFPLNPTTIADRLLALRMNWKPGMTPPVTRRDALVGVIDALHAEIAALKVNDIDALERSTATKLTHIDTLSKLGAGPNDADMRALADEAHRLNETCRIYVNLMAANVRRRLQDLTGTLPVYGARGIAGAYA